MKKGILLKEEVGFTAKPIPKEKPMPKKEIHNGKVQPKKK